MIIQERQKYLQYSGDLRPRLDRAGPGDLYRLPPPLPVCTAHIKKYTVRRLFFFCRFSDVHFPNIFQDHFTTTRKQGLKSFGIFQSRLGSECVSYLSLVVAVVSALPSGRFMLLFPAGAREAKRPDRFWCPTQSPTQRVPVFFPGGKAVGE